jgi:hypothetical protein
LSKKASLRRKENKKNYREGQFKAREKFVNKKFALLEELLSNEKKKEVLLAKELKELSGVEKAAIYTLSMKSVTLEDFNEKKEDWKKSQVISAKHKFGVK